jgi:hypothetical protein
MISIFIPKDYPDQEVKNDADNAGKTCQIQLGCDKMSV